MRDRELLEVARQEAEDLLSSPPTEETDRIVNHVIEAWGEKFGLATAG